MIRIFVGIYEYCYLYLLIYIYMLILFCENEIFKVNLLKLEMNFKMNGFLFWNIYKEKKLIKFYCFLLMKEIYMK